MGGLPQIPFVSLVPFVVTAFPVGTREPLAPRFRETPSAQGDAQSADNTLILKTFGDNSLDSRWAVS